MKSERETLCIAYHQVENLIELLKDNEWKTFLYKNLIPVKYELMRQQRLLENIDKAQTFNYN